MASQTQSKSCSFKTNEELRLSRDIYITFILQFLEMYFHVYCKFIKR